MSAGLLVAIGLTFVVLVGVSALFSAVETALFSLQPLHIERLKAHNPRFAASLHHLLDNPRRLLSAILLADACANLPLIMLSLFLLREVFPASVPFWTAALAIFAVIVVACDLVPKLVALRHPYRIAKTGVVIMNVVMPVLDPLGRVLQRFSEKAADLLTPERLKPQHFLSEDELETLVQLSAEEGTLHASESEMIQEIIKLGDKTAKDCMTPRVDVFAIPDDLSRDDAIAELKRNRYRRVPVYADTTDNILGVLDVKAFLLAPREPYTEVMTAPSFVPETMGALALLRNFLNHPQRLAIIVDEYGGTEGIVTLSDIVEEIISDAVPLAAQGLYIEDFGDGRLVVDGSARLDDLSEALGVDLEEEGLDTISGLIFNRLGYLPKPGAGIEIDGLSLTVRRTSRKRVEEVLIVKNEEVGAGYRSERNSEGDEAP